VWERRGEYRRVEEKRGKIRKRTDIPLHSCPESKKAIIAYSQYPHI
jgi:hypothetical protein